MRDVAVEDDVVIRLQAKSFSSFSYEQKWGYKQKVSAHFRMNKSETYLMQGGQYRTWSL